MNRRFTIPLIGLLIGVFVFLMIGKKRNEPDSLNDSTLEQPSHATQFLPAGTEPESNQLVPEPPMGAAPGSILEDARSDPVAISFEYSVETTNQPSLGSHDHVVREWKGQFSPTISDLANELGELNSAQMISLQLPSGKQVKVSISKLTRFDNTRGIIVGNIPNSPYSEVILSYVNQAVSGSIMTPETGEVIEIKNAGSGFQYIAQIDIDKLGNCGVCTPK